MTTTQHIIRQLECALTDETHRRERAERRAASLRLELGKVEWELKAARLALNTGMTLEQARNHLAPKGTQ